MNQNITNLFSQLQAELGNWENLGIVKPKTVHRPDWKPETENVDDLAERYQGQAAQLSPELRAKLVPGSKFLEAAE